MHVGVRKGVQVGFDSVRTEEEAGRKFPQESFYRAAKAVVVTMRREIERG